MEAKKLFGTDGIRGLSGSFPINGSGSRKIGAAIAKTLGKNSRSIRSAAVGRDTRKGGDLLLEELRRGLSLCGVKTFSTGVCPTPALVAFSLENGADAGIMISASHNPPEYNGFKIFNSEGFKIPHGTEKEIEKKFAELKEFPPSPADLKANGGENFDRFGAYISLLENSAPGKRDFRGIKIALDCANGAMCEIAPKVFEKTGAEMAVIGCEPDGENINKGCGSLETSPLGQTVKRHGAAFGAALDGDGDRVAFCDEKGKEVDGDLIIALFAQEMSESGRLRNPYIATTVMSNKGLEIFLKSIGIGTFRTDVGDRHVADLIKKEAINFGGEKSGHLIFPDHSTNGDGLLSALLVADIVKIKNKPLSQIVPKIKLFPQILKNVRVFEREPLNSVPGLSDARIKLEKLLGNGGRVHIRYSGTEPLARILVEGEDGRKVVAAADEIAGIIERELGVAKAKK